MAKIELIMPKMGESITDATILKWLKSVGDKVEIDESIVEIATDKVDSEVPSTHEGTIVEILYEEGDVVDVGKALVVIETETDANIEAETPTPSVSAPEINSAPFEKVAEEIPHVPAEKPAAPIVQNNSNASRFYSPLVLNIANKEGISMDVLESIPGTGKDNRVTKKDILKFVANGAKLPPEASKSIHTTEKQTIAPPKPTASVSKNIQPAISLNGSEEIIEMDRMRKMIAVNMIKSKQISAHVTSFVEADVTRIVNWRNKWKNTFLKREGQKLTFTPIFIEALIKAINDFPMINISVDGDKIIRKRNINIGMAAALPSGNLIVPVIHNANELNLLGLTKKVNDLANRARNNKLTPDEIQGGTYTISNVGNFGNVMGTPIIPQPQVAIMAVGAIKKKPVVIETKQGDYIGIRHMMMLSHSYDHRVVDGALGGMFVRKVADYLEQFDEDQSI